MNLLSSALASKLACIGFVILAFAALSACSKQEDQSSTQGQPSHSIAKAEHSKASAAHMEERRKAAAMAHSKKMAELARKLEAEYLAADAEKRESLIDDLGEIETPELPTILARLLKAEQDEHLKSDLMDALDDAEGPPAEKLAALAVAAQPDEPVEVRTDAIEAIGSLEDPHAVRVLQPLSDDPNEEVREAAREAIAELASASEQQAPVAN